MRPQSILPTAENSDPERVYWPPAPFSKNKISALFVNRFDLLSLLPRSSYQVLMGKHALAPRRGDIINPRIRCRSILVDKVDIYPKSDLMVDVLGPLLGNGIFSSNGDTWRRQHKMIEPAFDHMRMRQAFRNMNTAMDDFITRLAVQAPGCPSHHSAQPTGLLLIVGAIVLSF